MTSAVAVRYRRNFARRGTHGTLLALVPPSVDVLDVGCATGYLGTALIEHGCRVWGVEADSAAAREASRFYEDVATLDLDVTGELPWERRSFDAIVTADVLEHLRDPLRTLRMLRAYARPGAAFVVSLPNVAHVSVRIPLLFGRFRYAESGILDRTHCRLFTFETARELVESGGLDVEKALGGSNRFGRLLELPVAGPLLRGLLAYSIVMLAREPSS